MSLREACIAAIGMKPDADAMSTCFLSQATVDAAHVTADRALAAVIIAAVVGLIALVQPKLAAIYARETEQEHTSEFTKRLARTYRAEVISLRNFLDNANIGTRLTENAEKKTRFYFDPGESWLPSFQKNPSSAGFFDDATALLLVSYCTRMLNELGRLRWLHKLTADEVARMSMSAVNQEQRSSATTLTELGTLRDQLLLSFDALTRTPHRWGAGLR